MANLFRREHAWAVGYTKEHTEATRERILESAARLFRAHGFEGARIDDIMAGAGLTRGGFYAHFRSKNDLFAVYVGRELAFGRKVREAGEQGPRLRDGADRAIDYYLTPGNRHRIARGCTVVSNAADVARASPGTRRAFTRAFEGMRETFRDAADDAAEPDAAALAAIATCVGGVVLARALADESLIEDLLAACRASVDRELGG